jgi:hypothetical protein
MIARMRQVDDTTLIRRRAKPAIYACESLYSTVTDFAKLRGWSTSVPIRTAVW